MNRILIDPDICNGQPVIKGTRITSRTILEFLAAGDSIEDVLEEYPSLSREDVLDCFQFCNPTNIESESESVNAQRS